jgi:hypothetical protein
MQDFKYKPARAVARAQKNKIMQALFSTPLLEAQEICKRAIEHAGRLVFDLFEALQAKGYIERYDYQMKPWNNGYQIQFIPDCNWLSLKDKSTQIQTICSNRTTIYLQPCNFFNDYFLEKKQSFEGQLVRTQEIQGSLCRFVVTPEMDNEAILKEYVKITRERIQLITL